MGFADEVRSYFQVDAVLGDPAVYAAAHEELDALLPGGGSLAERYAAHRRREECPPDRLEAAVHALSSALRDRVRGQYGLPELETVRYEVVTDKPWSGFNYYEGNYRSRVAINADLPHRLSQLPHLVAHESYPGHHTEHCRKELGLVERADRVEHTVFLVNTPECLMAEGLADLGVQASIGEGWGPWAAEILGDLGLRFDGDLAERLAAAAAPLNRVRQDAAVMLHDRGAGTDEVVAYLQRWSLVSAERAAQQIRFLTHPLWRAYTSTYVEGFDLLSRWLADRPADQPVAERFLRLLDEPLTPRGRGRRAAGGLSRVRPGCPRGAHPRAVDGVVARRPPPGRAAVAGRPVGAVAGAPGARCCGRSWPSARARTRPGDGTAPRRCGPTPWPGRPSALRRTGGAARADQHRPELPGRGADAVRHGWDHWDDWYPLE